MKIIDEKKRFYWLGEQKKERSRRLWEEVFPEDGAQFLDYYHRYKMQENDVAGIFEGDTCIAMAHMNPYIAMLDGHRVNTYFLIAVATAKQYRHTGLMTYLLGEIFHKSQKEQIPFLFLEPADEKIYQKAGFATVARQSKLTLDAALQKEILKWYLIEEDEIKERRGDAADSSEVLLGDLEVHVAKNRYDDRAVADFARSVLKGKKDLYASRSAGYYTLKRQELASEGGSLIYLTHRGQVVASYAHWGAEEIEIIEPLAREGYEELLLMQILDQFFMEEKVIAIRAADVFLGIPQERIPSDARSDKVQTMIRITDIEALLKKMTMKSAGEMIIRILDPMIPENSGMWQWKSDGHKSQVSRYQGVREPEVTMDIRDFTEYLFREREIFFNEVV